MEWLQRSYNAAKLEINVNDEIQLTGRTECSIYNLPLARPLIELDGMNMCLAASVRRSNLAEVSLSRFALTYMASSKIARMTSVSCNR